MESVEAAQLVTRVAGGDQQAFAVIYDELAPMVFGVVRKVVRDQSHAEEVTQEAFVEIWRNAGRFDPERGSLRTWAATIAHRRAVDRVRSEQSHRDRQERDERREVAVTSTPEELVVASERQQVAIDALAQLVPAQREALHLAYFEGLTHVQIADRLGVALGTVKTRIRDGLIRLRGVKEVLG